MWTLKSGQKLKSLVFEDTWKCDSAKVFSPKNNLKGWLPPTKYRKVERKSIFVRLKEAGKWWEGQSRDDWLFARNAFLVFFPALKSHTALQSFGLRFVTEICKYTGKFVLQPTINLPFMRYLFYCHSCRMDPCFAQYSIALYINWNQICIAYICISRTIQFTAYLFQKKTHFFEQNYLGGVIYGNSSFFATTTKTPYVIALSIDQLTGHCKLTNI